MEWKRNTAVSQQMTSIGMSRYVLRDGISEKAPDLRKLSVKIKAIFNVNFFAYGFGVVNDAHDHLICVLGKHGKHVGAQCNIRVNAGRRLDQRP